MKGFTKGKGKGRKFIPTKTKKGSLYKKDLKKNVSTVAGDNSDLMRMKKSLDRIDQAKLMILVDVEDDSIPINKMLDMNQDTAGKDIANSNFAKNEAKHGSLGVRDDRLNGMIVKLNRDYGKHKKGDIGQMSSITSYGDKPVDVTVYWNDGDRYDTDIPTEDLSMLDPIDTPSRDTRNTEEITRGLDYVENGVRKTLPTSEPVIDPNDIDGKYDYDIGVNTADIVSLKYDPKEFANQLTHDSPKIEKFVDDIEDALEEKAYGVERQYSMRAEWRTVFSRNDVMEIGGLSSNELYSPNGGITVEILPDKIQISGHYSEVESSHARVFDLNQTKEALAFANKIMNDINNVIHVSYM